MTFSRYLLYKHVFLNSNPPPVL